jgi:capsular polysaccharide biosynthesis protein
MSLVQIVEVVMQEVLMMMAVAIVFLAPLSSQMRQG